MAQRLYDIHVRAKELLKQVQEDRIYNLPSLQLEVGDQVYLHSPADPKKLARKFLTRFKGPYTVIEKVSPVTYVIQRDADRADQQTVHVERLRLVRHDDEMKVWQRDLDNAREEIDVYNEYQQKQLMGRQRQAENNLAISEAEMNIEAHHRTTDNNKQ
jgi:hypothetical protein